MEKTYNPQEIETRWYQTWEQNNYFQPNGTGTPYCIMLPPPNITGSLHMGHGFQHTLMDALIRYHRMRNEDVLWQVGTDHASIATEMVVERQLTAENKTRRELGREKFIERVWQWKEESGSTISRQMRRLGVSADWSREQFMLDPEISKAVVEVFERLYEEGLIYRGKRLVNWDPHFLSAISDLEVISEETQGEIWHIRYPLVKGNGYMIVATTRPETLLGDVAVAVHPNDERYQKYIGQYLKLPLTDRTIPIIADETVDPEFGTGCVKITPAHDFNDNAIGQRHNLPLINIFTPDAHFNENTPKTYQGLERFKARKKIIEDLTAQSLLDKVEKHTLKIPRGDRSGVVIEPYLTDQWFMKMPPLAEPAIKAVENGTLRFVPENWDKTYFQWLNNIQDWCISRQLWWGHRIPAWYDNDGNVYVAKDEATARAKYQLSADIGLQQDNDVFDTWFSSALWPFATLGWPQQTAELKKYYPTNVLVTGFDIIFFWVARMIMLGLKFTGEIPFTEVYVTGLIRDHEGHKMSKSKGNVLDPIDLIDGIDLESLIKKRTQGLMQPAMAKKIEDATRKQFPNGIPAFGTDALRFTYCALASTGRDIRFDLGRVDGYRNFCNKLWNAARFVLMNNPHPLPSSGASRHLLPEGEGIPVNHWILSRLQQTIEQAHQHFKTYRFNLLAQALYEFTWNEYCDWYLELTKPILTGDNVTQQNSTRHTLLYVLETILRLLHPLMPFITEEIWQKVSPLLNIKGATLMLQAYPEFDATQIDQTATQEIEWLKNIILALRNIRGEMRINPGQTIPLICHKGISLDREQINKYQPYITTLAKINSITWLEENESPPPASIALVGDLQLLIPLAGLIDTKAETQRVEKELNKVKLELEKAQKKLSNENFVNSAPPAVVAQEKTRVAEWQATMVKLATQLEKLKAL
jgi:valyl-tRNA synthetase